jgi:hypothetical protein
MPPKTPGIPMLICYVSIMPIGYNDMIDPEKWSSQREMSPANIPQALRYIHIIPDRGEI